MRIAGPTSVFRSSSLNADFGAQAEFNRLDLSNSSYYGFNKGRFCLARNTRYGQERAYGSPSPASFLLPERLYSGGPTFACAAFPSMRPARADPADRIPYWRRGALTNSTEMRLPPPMLPFVGDTVSFVLFHDMGNVFTNAGDAWISALRIHQPDRDSCKILNDPPVPNPVPPGPTTSTGTQGHCSFDYFSHTAGLGVRYHTPLGRSA